MPSRCTPSAASSDSKRSGSGSRRSRSKIPRPIPDYAFYAYRGEQVTAERLAREACQIEIERLGKPIGKQEQYIAGYGGLRAFRLCRHGDVEGRSLGLAPGDLASSRRDSTSSSPGARGRPTRSSPSRGRRPVTTSQSSTAARRSRWRPRKGSGSATSIAWARSCTTLGAQATARFRDQRTAIEKM